MTDTNKKKLTINDIAKLCGVGKSTVSRVLNQDPMVNEETRKKVNSIIEKYKFTPSKSARAMRGTLIVLLVLSSLAWILMRKIKRLVPYYRSFIKTTLTLLF